MCARRYCAGKAFHHLDPRQARGAQDRPGVIRPAMLDEHFQHPVHRSIQLRQILCHLGRVVAASFVTPLARSEAA